MSARLKQWILIGAILVIAAALIGTIMVLTANNSKEDGLGSDEVGSRPSPDLALLSEPQSGSELPPEYLTDGWDPKDLPSMIPDSFRFLGENDEMGYWVARNGNDDVCFILVVPGTVSGSSCVPIVSFDANGVGLRVSAGPDSESRVGYLLPDRAEPEGVPSLTIEVPGVVRVPNSSKVGETFEVPVSSGAPIIIRMFP